MERTCKKCGETYSMEHFLKKGYYLTFLDNYKNGGMPSAFALTCTFCRKKLKDRTKRKIQEERQNCYEYHKIKLPLKQCNELIEQMKWEIRNKLYYQLKSLKNENSN